MQIINKSSSLAHIGGLLALLVVVLAFASADDDYFLKAPKSVPRIGRRSEFFLKSSKSLPRMGRGGPPSALTEGREWGQWPWFRTNDNRPGPSRRSESKGVPLTWSNIDRLMEEQPELWTPELLQSLKGEWELEDRPKRDEENEEPRLQPEV